MSLQISAQLRKEITKQASNLLILFDLLLLTIAGIIFVSLPSTAQEGSNKSGDRSKNSADNSSGLEKKSYSKPYGYYLKPMLDHIQANPDQRTKITAILQNYRGRLEPLRNEYNVKQQEFLSNVVKGFSSEVIMAQQTRLGQLSAEITSHYCQMSLEVRRILSPDQIIRYEEFKKKQGWSSQPTKAEAKQ